MIAPREETSMKYNPDAHHRRSVRLKDYEYSKEIGYPIWQRNCYEHVIRNEKELYKIIEYMI